MIEHTLSYLTKHGQNSCEDFKQNCIPCRCVKNVKRHRHAAKSDMFSNDVCETVSGERTASNKNMIADEIGILITESLHPWESDPNNCIIPVSDSSVGPVCDCCPLTCTSEVYVPYEQDRLDKYHIWQNSSIDNEMRMVRTAEQLEYLNKVIEKKH